MVKQKKDQTFTEFICDPPIAIAFLVFALVALVFSMLEFSKAISY